MGLKCLNVHFGEVLNYFRHDFFWRVHVDDSQITLKFLQVTMFGIKCVRDLLDDHSVQLLLTHYKCVLEAAGQLV